jgi:hypothetical protein
MRWFPPIFANLLLGISAIGYGNFLRALIPKSFSRLDRFVLTLLGGLGILGTILFSLGQIWFSRIAIVTVLLVGGVLSVRPLAAAFRECRPVLSKIRLPLLPAGTVLIVLAITAIGGLALPSGDMNDDAIAYHYLGPKVWLRERVIRPVPDEIQTYFPALVEAQYAALMSVGGQRAPGFFAVIGFACLLLTSASLAQRLGLGPTGAWWVAALIATMPAIYRGAYGGFLDAIFASFVLAAARMAFDAEQPGHFALFGIFSGISMGTKYTGIVAWGLLLFCSIVVSVWIYHRNAVVVWKWLAVSCLIAVAIASPSYIRNWVVCGSPMYPAPPAVMRVFTEQYLQPAAIQELMKNMVIDSRGMGGGMANFLLLPFHLTYHTANFRGGGGIGLAILALGPLGMIARRHDRFALGLLLFGALQVGAWFATAQVARYMVHAYVIAAVFAVLGWDYAAEVGSRSGRILSEVVVAISIVYGLWMIVKSRSEDMRAAASSSFEAKRQAEETPYAASFDYINRESSVRKILILNPGIAAYFIDKPYIKPFGRWGEQTLHATNPPEVLRLLPSLHATHILDVIQDNGSFALPREAPGLTLVFERGDQKVYRIDDEAEAVRPHP